MNEMTDHQETITASQRRHLFEELIGANSDKNHGLWRALDQVITSAQDERDESNHAAVAELARHFPALERALLIVWSHVTRVDLATPCSICEPGARPAPELD